MALIKTASRVANNTATQGQGTINLGAAVTVDADGNSVYFAAFADAFSTGDKVYYAIEDGALFETGVGTFTTGTPNTLSRDTVIRSSDAGAKIELSGSAIVFATYVGSKAVMLDDLGNIDINTAKIVRADEELLDFDDVASAVNYLQVGNSATGNPARLSALGDDSNVGIGLVGKGTGALSGSAVAALFRTHISGLLVTNDSGDAAHDVGVSVGSAAADDQSEMLILASALIKQLDATWAVGTNAGGMLSGDSLPTSGTVNVWLIRRSDTGVVDVVANDHANEGLSPTLPTDYDQKRRIGRLTTDGSDNIIAVTPIEIGGGAVYNLIDTPTLDIDLDNTLTTARRLDAVAVPVGIKHRARIRMRIYDAASNVVLLVTSPDEADAAPSSTATPLATAFSTTGKQAVMELEIYVDTSAQIAARANIATVDSYRVVTLGWTDARR